MSAQTADSPASVSVTGPGNRTIQIVLRTTPARSRTILLLHGLAGSGACFAAATDELDTERYQLVIPDLPGHGRSGHQDGFPYSPTWYTDVLRELLRSRSWPPDAIIGHSMGGTIALLLAEKMAPRPQLINVEGLPESLEFLARRVERYDDGPRDEGYRRVLKELRHATDPGIQAWLEWAENTHPDAFFESAGSFSAFWKEHGMMDRYRAYPPAKRHYVCGEDGQAAYVRGELDRDEYDVISGAAHFPMVNNSEAFWSVVRRCLTA